MAGGFFSTTATFMQNRPSHSPATPAQPFGWQLALIRPPARELRELVADGPPRAAALPDDLIDHVVSHDGRTGHNSRFRKANPMTATGTFGRKSAALLKNAGPSTTGLGGALARGGATPMAHCCHLDFSPSGKHVVATFSNGYAELLFFPRLHRVCVLNPPGDHGGCAILSGGCWRSFFVRHPGRTSRASAGKTAAGQDDSLAKDLYVLSQASASEFVLYEVYPIGQNYAKTTVATFEVTRQNSGTSDGHGGDVLRDSIGAAGLAAAKLQHSPVVTDATVHPSQLFLLVTALLPGLDQPQLLVFDLWGEQGGNAGGARVERNLLFQTALFSSNLISSLAPLRPSLATDPTGSFVYVASTPAWVGNFDQAARDLGRAPIRSTVTDSVVVEKENVDANGFFCAELDPASEFGAKNPLPPNPRKTLQNYADHKHVCYLQVVWDSFRSRMAC